jgi:hypothetical protein
MNIGKINPFKYYILSFSNEIYEEKELIENEDKEFLNNVF